MTNIATYPRAADGYAKNLGRAALHFLDALLAVQPAAASRVRDVEVTSGRTVSSADLWKLYRLSSSTDTVRPDVIAALNTIAERK